ncbi:conserved hypothetical protein [Pirellula staleyi DSM 6068]|uniref:Uncharacterized protein n=1 Tax=Pirellula staleyi (strain ATCC 27377 / DSM 6068 / ICPB 4128) TaxID=530564 RepID=D2R435_PIRSD|nr:hypothetical protein [Pirellula staleyi]ADB18884.1 conserved hypothetical protein [Pirellula staleyi DSM 6068]
MSNINPYAYTPAAPNPFAEQVAVPTGPQVTMWRKGNVLVMFKHAPIPKEICILSNQPATRTLKRNLTWHPPLVYLALLANLIIYAVIAMIMQKKAVIDIPLTEEWYKRRQTRMLIAWSIALLGVVAFIAGVANANSDIVGFLILAGIVMVLGAAVYGIVGCRLVVPQRIDDNYVWLKGVHPDYLNRLPPWPYNP